VRRAPCISALLVLLVALVGGCSHAPPDATPDGALKLFLEDLEQASTDPRQMRHAYELLGPAARANLAERARRTITRLGRQVQPWDMMAAGRFGLTFSPKVMRVAKVGDRATVEVFGADATNQHASVVCVHEAGGWRVEPGFPDP
jgi:hypothetical protein